MTTRTVLAGTSAVALALAFFAPSPAAAQSEEIKTISLEMYLDLETVSSPQISPNGQQIVYTRGWIDKMNDERESSIWIMNADGSRNRFLVDGSGPLWSPDGTRIAYTGEGEPEGSQIFVRWMDAEGATSQVTRVERGPSGLRWSPDGDMGGRELYERLLKQNPALAARTIFITGDTVSPDTRSFLQDVKNPVLAKPFKLREVRETIGRILDES